MNKFIIIVLLLVTCIDVAKSSSIFGETTEPVADLCYYCSICPQPFRPDGDDVSTTPSATGWCVMKSVTNESDSDYELGVAYTGLCHDEGCSWTLADGVIKWVCCCNEHLCNTGFPIPSTTTPTSGVSISKSAILVLISALMIVII